MRSEMLDPHEFTLIIAPAQKLRLYPNTSPNPTSLMNSLGQADPNFKYEVHSPAHGLDFLDQLLD